MTALTRNKRFGAITGFAGPLPSPLIALGGPSNTVLHAQKTGSRLEFLGESADLGGTVLAGDNTSGTNCHVLTSAGLVLVSNANAPVVSVSTEFDPGDGRWLARFGNFVATPLAFGGIQTVRYNTLARVAVLPNLTADSRFAAGNPATGHLWIADGRTASISTVKVNLTTGSLAYIGKTTAPNCREIAKVVLDDETGDLFVVCRRRIVRFTVPLTDVEDPRPTFAEDFGIARVDYTDFLALGGGRYWIGQDSVDAPSPLPFFYGPMFGAWAPGLGDHGELFVAAARSAVWTVCNAIPVYTDIGDSIFTPPIVTPPVIQPNPPVITSALTGDALAGVAWSYTITATGEAPITFGVDAPPAWLSVDALTGTISGTPPTSAVVNIAITATNAGGTATSTLVLTVLAIANLGAVTVDDGDVRSMRTVGTLLYIGGTFTTVSDANGSHSRLRLACIDLTTGLWTTWNPGCTDTVFAIEPLGNYLFIGTTAATLAGVAVTGLGRVHKTTGIADAGFVPALAGGGGEVYALLADESANSLYVGGAFTTYDGNSRESGIAKITALALTGWYPTNSGDRATQGDIRSIVDAGTSVLWGGHSNVRITDTVHNKVFSFGRSAKSSGATPTYTWGGYNTFQVDAVAASGGRDYIGGIFVGFDKIYDSSDFVNRTNLGAVDGAGSVAGFAPNPASQVKALYVNPNTGNIFVGTDKVRQYDSSGSSAATPTWTGGTGINALARIGPALVIGGSFLSAVINGATRTRLALMNIATGVVY